MWFPLRWQRNKTPEFGAFLAAKIKNTKTSFGIDFGVGDVIVPKQEKRKMPTQLDNFAAPTVNTIRW